MNDNKYQDNEYRSIGSSERVESVEGRDRAAGGAPSSPPRRRGPRRLVVLVGLAIVAAVVAIVISHTLPSGVSAAPSAGTASTAATTVKNTRAVKPLSLSAIAARVDPGLVDVNVVFGYQGARGAGTGIVLTPTGEVLTNNHVIDGATSVSVTDLGNGKTYSASVVGYDRSRDLAILRLSGARGLATAPIGNSSTLKLGARVTAIGNAGGRGGTPSMARGTVTALHQSIIAGDPGGGNFEHLHGLVETNANIQPGDSGGPLVNIYGQIVAMDTAASGGPQLSSTATQGFAIPINEALSVGRQIEARTGSSTVHIGPTAFLGVGIAAPGAVGGTTSSGSSFSGALIGSVLQGSPAQRAGLAGGDVITSLGGHAVRSGAGLADTLIPYHPGDTVQVQWVDQSGTVHSASVTLAIGPSA